MLPLEHSAILLTGLSNICLETCFLAIWSGRFTQVLLYQFAGIQNEKGKEHNIAIFIIVNSEDHGEILLHFIWVFLVCQRPDLWVCSIWRVKIWASNYGHIELKSYPNVRISKLFRGKNVFFIDL